MKKHPPTTEHNYLKKVLKMAAEHEATRTGPPELRDVDVDHDDWCDFLKKRPKFCNCNPTVTLRPRLKEFN